MVSYEFLVSTKTGVKLVRFFCVCCFVFVIRVWLFVFVVLCFVVCFWWFVFVVLCLVVCVYFYKEGLWGSSCFPKMTREMGMV